MRNENSDTAPESGVPPPAPAGAGRQRRFRVLPLVIVILLILLGISAASQWYAHNVTMPRYCQAPDQALRDVRQLLTSSTPAGVGARRPYIIAARLTFLVPREGDEPLEDYLRRIQRHLDQQCP